MSDSAQDRRQLPSPLVLSSEHASANVPPPKSSTAGSNYSAGPNTVSMPFVRRHVTRRLKTAKAECDKELQRVTNSITTWFEERLRDGDHERESEREMRELQRDRDRDREREYLLPHGENEMLREPFSFMPGELRSALPTDESSSDGGYDAEFESSRYGPQRGASTDDDFRPHLLTHRSSSPGLHTASSVPSLSPSLRRQSTMPWEKSMNSSLSSSGAPPPQSTCAFAFVKIYRAFLLTSYQQLGTPRVCPADYPAPYISPSAMLSPPKVPDPHLVLDHPYLQMHSLISPTLIAACPLPLL
jgi:serine/threonine-protein kinase RIM15